MTDMIVMDMIHTLFSVITAYGINVDYLIQQNCLIYGKTFLFSCKDVSINCD